MGSAAEHWQMEGLRVHELLDPVAHKDKHRRLMDDDNRPAAGAGGAGAGGAGGSGVGGTMFNGGCDWSYPDCRMTFCPKCNNLLPVSGFRSELQRHDLESDFEEVASELEKEKAVTQRSAESLKSFREMLLQGIHADVTIETGESDKTPAHRAVLASRSPVFRAMFEHELQEKNCAIIHVADVPTPAMRALLLFLYTGDHDTKVMKEHSMALLTAAHKYDISDLKRVCEVAIANAVQPSNVLEILQQARLYDAALVKKACVECIAENLREVAFTEEFRHLVHRNDDPEATLQIIQSIATNQ